MAEFQWWVLIAGLVVGGTVVGLLSATFGRGDEDLESDEREAEASFIAGHLGATGPYVDRATVARVLEAHREYLGLPAPTSLVGADTAAASAGDRHPDDESDDVGHARRGAADGDLTGA